MAITNEGLKENIQRVLEELEIAKASLEKQQHTLEVEKEFQLMQEDLKGLQLKIEQQEDFEYRLQQEEQQDRLDETNQDLADQQQQTKEEVQRAIKGASHSPLPPTKREALEIKRQFQNIQNFKDKSPQEFENSKEHIDDDIMHVKPSYNQNLGTLKEQEGLDSLDYPKTLKESLLSNQQIIECANDSSRYNQANLFASTPDISPVPTPGNHRREEEEYSTYTASIRA